MRSWLFVPADSERKVAKAFGTAADVIILDLEDSVAPQRKAAARALAAETIAGAGSTERIAVRVNPLTSEAIDADLAVVAKGPAYVVLPKSQTGADVAHLSAKLSVIEAEADSEDGTTKIMAIATETAASLFGLGTYGGASQRLCALAWGAEDLSTALSTARTRTEDGRLTDTFRLARTLTLLGAHAAGAVPLDTVHTALGEDAALEAECRAAAADGFGGKMAIHPAQVPIINAAFTPSADAIAAAQRLVDAFAAAPDAGVLTLDGMMVDRPHLEKARQLLARIR